MNTTEKTAVNKDRRALLSTLWLFATLNYIYCDVLTLMDPVYLNRLITGSVGIIHVTQGFLLGASILMEIPMAMVLLSRVLKNGANRWASIIAGTIMTLVQLLSLFAGTPTIYYLFFSVIEIACTAFIAWYAWKWTQVEPE